MDGFDLPDTLMGGDCESDSVEVAQGTAEYAIHAMARLMEVMRDKDMLTDADIRYVAKGGSK